MIVRETVREQVGIEENLILNDDISAATLTGMPTGSLHVSYYELL